MGMFDDLRCRYPLPVAGANDLSYQTKDLECWLDQYEIREDGTLWHEAYDHREEVSDDAPLGVWWHRDNKRWEPVPYTGEIRFYTSLRREQPCGWIEWSAYFVGGAIREVHLLSHEEPKAVDAVDPDDGEGQSGLRAHDPSLAVSSSTEQTTKDDGR